MTDNIFNKRWFHGTNDNFHEWQSPPPQNVSKGVPHSGIFFTTNIDFAKAAGKNLAEIEIKESSNILDTISNSEKSEELRQRLVKNNNLFASMHNSHKDKWHSGWKDGSVLRPMIQINTLADTQYKNFLSHNTKEYGAEAAKLLTGHQFTRGLIEIICKEAKLMSFDGIYGHEIDRWNKHNQVISQPWLCIFNKKIISQPNWIS